MVKERTIMREPKKIYSIIIVLLFINNILLFGQDTIYTIPSGKEISASLPIKIEKSINVFKYAYHISSSKDSKQNIYEFFLEYDARVDSILSPFNWDGRESSVRKKIISWGSIDSAYDILPNNVLGGFDLISRGLPAIQKYYLRGYTEPLSFSEGEAPDLSQIRNWDIFENSFKGWTIGPSNPPYPFVPLDFLDTLKIYVNKSYSLKWIIDKKEDDKEKGDKEKEKGSKLVKELMKYLDKAREQLVKNKIKEAKKQLKEFIKEVEEYYKKSSEEGEKEKVGHYYFSSEAYALLKYNAEYLIEQLK
jgi:hypothetical protein